MPSAHPSESKMSHPVLGPAIVIGDDRRRTKWRMTFWILVIPLSVMGLFFAKGDLENQNYLFAAGQTAASAVVIAYAIAMLQIDGRRMRHPAVLAVGRDGFQFMENSPVTWDEVEGVSDPRAPEMDPRSIRIQLVDPRDFTSRHWLSQLDRLMLRVNRGDLVLGGGLDRPLVDVQALMRKQLDEFHRAQSGTPPPAARARQIRGRRPINKSR